jgi:hypothetical protein
MDAGTYLGREERLQEELDRAEMSLVKAQSRVRNLRAELKAEQDRRRVLVADGQVTFIGS